MSEITTSTRKIKKRIFAIPADAPATPATMATSTLKLTTEQVEFLEWAAKLESITPSNIVLLMSAVSLLISTITQSAAIADLFDAPAHAVGCAADDGVFPVFLGGDCSISRLSPPEGSSPQRDCDNILAY